MRRPHASIWLGLREGPRLLDLHLDKALPHQPCRSQGDWLDVCSLPPPSASAETWQHSSPCGKPLLCLNLVLVVLTLSNPSSSLSLCCKPTALCTGVMDHAGCLQTPFSPMPFFVSLHAITESLCEETRLLTALGSSELCCWGEDVILPRKWNLSF